MGLPPGVTVCQDDTVRANGPQRNDLDERLTALMARLDEIDARTTATAQHSDAQAIALLAAVDDRLQALLAHLDKRTAVLADLEVLPQRVIDEVGRATASVLERHVQALVARLADAADTLVHAEGRIEALSRGHGGEARAGEERLGSAFGQVADRMESAVQATDDRLSRLEEASGALRDDLEQMASVTINAIEELRAVQSALRDAVEEGSRQAGVAANDVRALREHLGPHLAALIEATTRRADAEQAGFDAVLGRIDRLLHERERPGAPST